MASATAASLVAPTVSRAMSSIACRTPSLRGRVVFKRVTVLNVKLVPDVTNCDEVARVLGIILETVSQLGHVGVDGAVGAALGRRGGLAPQAGLQLLPTEGLARRTG